MRDYLYTVLREKHPDLHYAQICAMVNEIMERIERYDYCGTV